ncbi:MAG: histidine phosphatase family protein [Cyanobacteriota bacterium]|nr:histidine phosphatase family protein [Cyanobacteriota bacterium]
MKHKQLIFFRHGKSDWQVSSGVDRDRPLAPRGVAAAQAMGRLLTTLDAQPDHAITSPAVRAHSTLELAREAGQWSCTVAVSADLYEASPEQVLGVIRGQSDRHQRLLLVGHQPTWSETISWLMGGGQVEVPTATLVCLDLQTDTWPQVTSGQAVLLWLLPPKLLSPLLNRSP